MSKSKPQSDPKPTPKWQSVAWQKKDQQFARIPNQWRLPQLPPSTVTNFLQVPRECGLLTEKELDITGHCDATALAQAIRERKFTCVDVTTAFCKVHWSQDDIDRTNCLRELQLHTN
jgi:amidase